MSFLRFLLFLPTMVVLAVLAFFSSGDVKTEIWPFLGENGEPLVVEIKISILIIALSFFVFLYAKIDSWFAYSGLRSELRAQKRQNKKLNVEQKKLVEEVEGLRENIDSVTPIVPKNKKEGKLEAFKNKVSSWFKPKPKEDDFWCL